MKKNILFLTNSKIIGGAEICLLNILTGLQKYPLKMALAYPRQNEAKSLFLNLKIKSFNIDLGGSTIKYRGLNLFSPSMLSDYSKLKKIIEKKNRQRKIDLIFCQQDPKEKIISAKVAAELKIPIIWMEHSKLHPWQEKFHFRLLYKHFSKKTKKIIAVSQAVKDSLVKIGIEAKKIEVVLNGVEVKKLRHKTITKLRRVWNLEGRIVFGVSSRLNYKKGVHELLLATQKAIRINKKIVLLIMGSGKEEEKLKDLALKLKIQKQVRFVGFQKNAAAKSELFDVVVSPSFDEGEGLPLRIMEGMALSKPVISTDISGSKEEVFEGLNGYLFKPHDVNRLSSLLLKLASDKKLREKMGRESKIIFDRLFTLKKMTNNIYRAILMTIK